MTLAFEQYHVYAVVYCSALDLSIATKLGSFYNSMYYHSDNPELHNHQ